MSTEDQIVPEQVTVPDISNRVLCVSWNNGIMGAVFYDLATMELTLGNFVSKLDIKSCTTMCSYFSSRNF